MSMAQSPQRRSLSFTHRTRVIIVAVVCGLAAVGLIISRPWSHDRKHTGSHASSSESPTPQEPSKKQLAALRLNYPPSTGVLPASITSEYLDAKDRTRTTLQLKDLSAETTGPYRVANIELKLVSEYHGRERPREYGESVVEGSLSLVSGTSGSLSIGSDVGVFMADGREFPLRPAVSGKPAYSSKKIQHGDSEKVNFKIDTAEMVQVVNAHRAGVRIGRITVWLRERELADVREFVARMKPGGPA